MSERLHIDLEETKELIKRIEDLTGDLRQISNKYFSETMQEISENWEGEAKESYIIKGIELEKRIDLTIEDLSLVSEELNNILQQFISEEE